ncbi:hypothetical protein V6N11_002116 [Hibiscus sabdariffa]|uniref:Uncharacterized protein n=1 Tax=Hibiscus sabdariffa TaxID=183260 RepID=A0ABR2QUU0_9ROSI
MMLSLFLEDAHGNPKHLLFREWLRVDFEKPKHAGLRHPKQWIVLTKWDVADGETSSNVVRESGTRVPHPSQAMVVGGDHGTNACVEDTKSKSPSIPMCERTMMAALSLRRPIRLMNEGELMVQGWLGGGSDELPLVVADVWWE